MLLACLFALGFCAWLLLRQSEHRKLASAQDLANTNQPSRMSNAATKSNLVHVVQPALSDWSNSGPTLSEIEKSNILAQRTLELWQGTINFYGKVEDEGNHAVAGATINFDWSEAPKESGFRRANITSDAQGLFSLKNERGLSLGVSVSKKGYYPCRTETFNFGPLKGTPFQPDSLNPVVFHLHTTGKGAALIATRFPSGIGQIVQLHHDGTPIEISLMDGQQAAPGTGQLKLELHRDISHPNAPTFDWSFQLAVPNGGLAKAQDEFPFEAPDTGYQPSLTVNMPATNADWTEDFASQYYLQLPGEKYGRINLNLSAYNGTFTLKSWINPSGSHDLEPDN